MKALCQLDSLQCVTKMIFFSFSTTLEMKERYRDIASPVPEFGKFFEK